MPDSMLISRRQFADVCSIELPASKSILNRYIIMSALQSGRVPEVLKITDADDAKLMFEVVRRITGDYFDESGLLELNCGNAGTVVRMAALLAAFNGKRFLLTGNKRMFLRPVNELVEILLQTGASVNFQGKKGFLPLIVDSHEFIRHKFEHHF